MAGIVNKVYYLVPITGADPGFFCRRGCTRLLPYFNTNKPVFLQNTSCIRKPQVISGGGEVAHPLHPPPRSAPALPMHRILDL